jgi:hypothetical protein
LQVAQLEAASVVRQAAKSAQEVLKPALSNNPAVAARQQAAIDELTELLRQLNSLSRLQQTMKDIRFWEKRYSGANGTKTGII